MRSADLRSSIAFAAALLASTTATAATVSPTAHAPTAQAAPAPLARVATPASAASTMAAAATALPIADLCPPQLPVKQTVSATIADWTPLDAQGNYPFVRVALYPGPPADTSLIVPTIEFQGVGGLHDGWDLPARAGGYWMTCAYANTTATLTRQLPAGVDFCQADYDKRFLTLVVRHWSCGLRRTMVLPTPGHSGLRPATKPAPKSTTRRGG